MGSTISIRDLRNDASSVVRRVEAGETLTVTVDRRPVATLSPLPRKRRFLAGIEVADALSRVAADPDLLRDLRETVPDTTDDIAIER